MKNEEDEAFDDLAKKQGMWGGGFKAKKAMAADKLQEPAQRPWVGLTDEELADCLDMSIQKTCRAIEAKLKEKNND
jgi:hypothetical protein